jgi:tRNA A-37 threonylcarbamoyl transferase component Bud32
MNTPWAGADSFKWDEVKCIRSATHCPKLYPLPKTTMPDIPFIQDVLNRLALAIDSLSARTNDEEFLLIRSQTYGGNEIKIRLSELSAEERAQLFYALRKWAPENVISEEVQEQMIGSSVLQAPRYTQMWFELLTRDSQVKHAGALKPGTELRDVELKVVSRLASGGQANVYLATKSDGSEVVLKEFILSTSDAVGSLIESAAEFETETSLLSQVQHSHIVKMLDYFAENRRLYIVLEKVEGESLRQRIKRTGTPMSETEVVDVAQQLCQVLQYLHSQEPPIVHRDVTPDNIMFSDSKQIKLIDFSLAAAKKSHKTSSTMGKHCYAPPEQFREEACPQSDLYAVGATMYYLLTGEDPKPITSSDLLEKSPQANARLAEIIKRATAFDLADRTQSAEWMEFELKSILDSQKE